MNNLDEYLSNKKVIIVGPSPSILTREDGSLIDSYDVVCRIKKSFPVPNNLEKHLGKRTDILISHLKLRSRGYNQNNFKLHKPKVFNNNLKYIYFPYPLCKHFTRFYNTFKKDFKKINVPIVYQKQEKNLIMLRKELNNYDPTAALAAITGLLDYNIKELYITGITFQKDGFLEYYKTKKEDTKCVERTKKVHNSANEFEYFKKLIRKEKRIKMDITLEKLVK